jgi:pyruvate formate lyase activating enzyme
MDTLASRAMPEDIAQACVARGIKSIAFTYNDPVIFLEYAVDVAKACRERGIKTVAVTAGYVAPEARRELYSVMDAANVDLKAFSEEFYREITKSHLQPVLDGLKYLKDETGVWFEITTLLIPGHNDSDGELHRESEWLMANLGPDVPLHFSAFHPDFKMLDVPHTPAETLRRARKIALSHGLRYVYTGNVHDLEGDTTYCSRCKTRLIVRDWYELIEFALKDGKCPECGEVCPGRFDGGASGSWGRRRMRVFFDGQ